MVLRDLQDNWNKMGGHKTWCHQVLCSYGSMVTLIKPRSFQENILQKVNRVVQVETPKTQYLHLLHMLVCVKGCAQVVGCAKWFEKTTTRKKIMFNICWKAISPKEIWKITIQFATKTQLWQTWMTTKCFTHLKQVPLNN